LLSNAIDPNLSIALAGSGVPPGQLLPREHVELGSVGCGHEQKCNCDLTYRANKDQA